MPDYRRWFEPGDTYFFTVVTDGRVPIFREERAVRLLGDVMRHVRDLYPFETVAIAVLLDHLHCVWSLPPTDERFSTRWQLIKGEFSERWLAAGGHEIAQSLSKRGKGERGVWQRRFWEHVIRDEVDLERHVDYIHYNPVKHGYVARACDWPWSSFHRFVASGDYDAEWGKAEPESPHYRVPE